MDARSALLLAWDDVVWQPSIVLLAVACLLLAVGLLLALRACRKWRMAAHSRARELTATGEVVAQQDAEIKKLAREVARLQRMPKARIQTMLQLAHELRSPLAAVQNVLDMLLQGYATANPDLQSQVLGVARDRTVAMLARISDFVRLGAVQQYSEADRKLGPVQLLDVLSGLEPEMQIRARWRTIRLELIVPDTLPPVRGTREDMELVLSNLISNAIKYTRPGGRVTVALRLDQDDVIGTVSDTGIGIVAEDLTKIFDEFYRANEARDMDADGTGLGLSIVKRIVNLCGGKIYVESELGQGSTFTFSFPKLEMSSEGCA